MNDLSYFMRFQTARQSETHSTNILFVNPRPDTFWTTGLGVFNKAKKNKRRNPIAEAHRKRGGAGAGVHKDKKKEQNKRRCRQNIKRDIF